jgi:beta-galactosidase
MGTAVAEDAAEGIGKVDSPMLPDIPREDTFYPKSWGMALGNKPWELMLYYGIPRAAAERARKPYFISELQTHTQSLLTPGSEISPQELRLFIWAALAAGGDAIQLWRWRPFLRGCQSSGRGLTSLDGVPGERAHEVAAIVKSLRRHAPRLEGSRPAPPDVRILLGYRSRLFFDAFRYWGPSAQPAEVCGWHRVFTALGVAVEAGSIEHLDEEYLKTPVIVLPALISLDEEQVRWLEDYVRNGGCLIADARLNAVDSWGNVRKEGPPGSVLSEVFGVVEIDVGPASSFHWEDVELQASFMTQQVRVSPGAKVLAADPNGTKLRAFGDVGRPSRLPACREDSRRDACSTSLKLATFAADHASFPMVISHRYGLGQTLYFACMPGMEWKENPPAGLAELLRSHLPLAAEHVVKKPESTIVRWHCGPEGELAYVMNFGTGDALVQFAPRGGCSARELMSGDGVASEGLSVPPAGVRLVEWRAGT